MRRMYTNKQLNEIISNHFVDKKLVYSKAFDSEGTILPSIEEFNYRDINGLYYIEMVDNSDKGSEDPKTYGYTTYLKWGFNSKDSTCRKSPVFVSKDNKLIYLEMDLNEFPPSIKLKVVEGVVTFENYTLNIYEY